MLASRAKTIMFVKFIELTVFLNPHPLALGRLLFSVLENKQTVFCVLCEPLWILSGIWLVWLINQKLDLLNDVFPNILVHVHPPPKVSLQK